MSLFRREAEAENPSPRPPGQPAGPGHQAGGARERAVTRIADGTRIVGEVSGPTELLVEGEVEGQIRVESRVVVGQGGVVRGQVTARSVLVAGTVEGDVRGTERVEVGGSGKLQGDIAAPRVTIAEGAFFKGKVEMGGGERGRRPTPPERPGAALPGGGGHPTARPSPERRGLGPGPGGSPSGGGGGE